LLVSFGPTVPVSASREGLDPWHEERGCNCQQACNQGLVEKVKFREACDAHGSDFNAVEAPARRTKYEKPGGDNSNAMEAREVGDDDDAGKGKGFDAGTRAGKRRTSAW
jgi:hypothetical protein